MAYCKLFKLRQFAIEKQGKGNDSISVSLMQKVSLSYYSCLLLSRMTLQNLFVFYFILLL